MSKVCVAASAKSLQSCLTLCNPIDGSPPGSLILGILQARTLEWVAISFSNAWKWKVKVKSLSRVRLLATPWTAAYQAPPPMEFSRQEYWRGLPLPSLKLCATQRVYHSNKKEAIFIVSEFYNLMHKGQKKISMGIFKYNFKGERSLLRWWISYFNRQ